MFMFIEYHVFTQALRAADDFMIAENILVSIVFHSINIDGRFKYDKKVLIYLQIY